MVAMDTRSRMVIAILRALSAALIMITAIAITARSSANLKSSQSERPNDSEQEYKALITPVESFIEKLNRAGKEGYRLKQVAVDDQYGQYSSGPDDVVAHLKLAAILSSEPTNHSQHEYKICGGGSSKLLEQDLNECCRQGWRLVSMNSFIYTFRVGRSSVKAAANLAVVEREIESTKGRTWCYKVRPFVIKAAGGIRQAGEEGFYPVQFVYTAEPKWFLLDLPLVEQAVVMESPEGDLPLENSPRQVSDILLFRLLISGGDKKEPQGNNRIPKIATSEDPRGKDLTSRYKAFRVHGSGKRFIRTLSDEITKESATGSRYCGITEVFGEREAIFKAGDQFASQKTPQYRLLSEPPFENEGSDKHRVPKLNDPKSFQESLNDNVASGYRPIDLVYTGDIVAIILENAHSKVIR